MSSLEQLNLEPPERLKSEILSELPSYELATEENINQLGYTIKLRVPDFGKPLAEPEKEAKRQEDRLLPSEWKPLGFVRSESGLLIKMAEFVQGQRAAETQYSKPYALFPVQILSGLRPVKFEAGVEGIALRYYKQYQGEEPDERMIVPSGFAYGLHPGHMGDPDAGIPEESLGWYLVGEQVEHRDGQIVVMGERAFPLSRIIDGPIGDPREPKHRETFRLY